MFERLLVRLSASEYREKFVLKGGMLVAAIVGLEFNKSIFADALSATAAHRGTVEQIADVPAILHNIEESPELRSMWEKYRKQFAYAADIEYDQIMGVLKTLVSDN